MICLDEIQLNNQYLIIHNKCKYIIHKECNYKYNKCLYCHKELNIRPNKELISIIDSLIDLFIPQFLDCTFDNRPIIYIIRFNYILLFIIFIICPIIIIYKFQYKLMFIFFFVYYHFSQ